MKTCIKTTEYSSNIVLSTVQPPIYVCERDVLKHCFPGVTILLSLTIFLNTVSAIIPITSDSPLIGNYYTRNILEYALQCWQQKGCSELL